MNTPAQDQTLAGLDARLRAGEQTAVALAGRLLDRIQAQEDLGVFLAVDSAATLAQAEAADARLAAGDGARLLGVPIALDDRIVTRDWPATAASRMLHGYRSPFDAGVAARALEGGLVNLGKLNNTEFGVEGGEARSALLPVHLPGDVPEVLRSDTVAAALAVAAGLAPAAVQVDTGGAMRRAAAGIGLTAVRPTYGRASRYGLIAQVSSMDQAGVVVPTAQDGALLLSVLCGPDPEHDATSLDVPAEDFTQSLDASIQGLRIGVPGADVLGRWSADAVVALEAALVVLEELGAQRVEVALPTLRAATPAFLALAAAEICSNLARYDGVRFGHRAQEFGDLEDMYERSRGEGFGSEVKLRILAGMHVLSEQHYKTTYQQAQRVRALVARDFQRAFETCDLMLGAMLSADDGTAISPQAAAVSLAGLPAVALPGAALADGQPLGLQVVGPCLQEARLLSVAHQLQQVTDWHQFRPRGLAA